MAKILKKWPVFQFLYCYAQEAGVASESLIWLYLPHLVLLLLWLVYCPVFQRKRKALNYLSLPKIYSWDICKVGQPSETLWSKLICQAIAILWHSDTTSKLGLLGNVLAPHRPGHPLLLSEKKRWRKDLGRVWVSCQNAHLRQPGQCDLGSTPGFPQRSTDIVLAFLLLIIPKFTWKSHFNCKVSGHKTWKCSSILSDAHRKVRFPLLRKNDTVLWN